MDYYYMFNALSDSIRLDILVELNKGEKTAGEIAEKFNLTNSKASYHFTVLSKVGFISKRRYKNFIFYTIKKENMKLISEWVNCFLWKTYKGEPINLVRVLLGR